MNPYVEYSAIQSIKLDTGICLTQKQELVGQRMSIQDRYERREKAASLVEEAVRRFLRTESRSLRDWGMFINHLSNKGSITGFNDKNAKNIITGNMFNISEDDIGYVVFPMLYRLIDDAGPSSKTSLAHGIQLFIASIVTAVIERTEDVSMVVSSLLLGSRVNGYPDHFNLIDNNVFYMIENKYDLIKDIISPLSDMFANDKSNLDIRFLDSLRDPKYYDRVIDVMVRDHASAGHSVAVTDTNYEYFEKALDTINMETLKDFLIITIKNAEGGTKRINRRFVQKMLERSTDTQKTEKATKYMKLLGI